MPSKTIRNLAALEENFILKTDSYKHSHHKMSPTGLEETYSYLESRGGKFNDVVFFGLHYILQKHFEGVLVTHEVIDKAKTIVDAHMGPGVFNFEGWNHIADKCGGKLPLRIKALPEGTVVPNFIPMITVENTDKKCGFLTNFAETILVQTWYPTTVATNSREMLKIIKKYLELTADNLDGLPFKLHDFGFRGSTSCESAGIGGLAHLVNSSGTDTMAALVVAVEYYNHTGMPAFSIPATEHSIMCSWTRPEEYTGVKTILERHPAGLVACVSDTYNIYNACKHYATVLRDTIMGRDGTFVVRPDSGHPPDVVLACLEILWEGFGDKGSHVGVDKKYKLLPPQIRLIQGDGIDHTMLGKILETMEKACWSTDNIAFGSGGGLLQNVNRDTLKIAFKASSYVVNGARFDERKDPITDPGKRSKKGRFKVVRNNGTLECVQEADPGEDLLEVVFENGEILVHPDFEDIRKRASLINK